MNDKSESSCAQIRYTPTLNKVDKYIKSMMLNYPVFAKSRFTALNHLFLLNGNGYSWDEKGCLFLPNQKQQKSEMDFSDLDSNMTELEKKLADNNQEFTSKSLLAVRLAKLKRQYTERRLIAEDIDLYAVEHVLGEKEQYGVEWLRHFYPDSCVLTHAPFDSLDPEWASAAEEIMTIAKDAIWRFMGMYSERFSRERADPALLKKYDQIQSFLDRLDKTTGTKARNAEIDKILAEESIRNREA